MSIVRPARTVPALVLALACASAAAARAQTWEWDVAARGADQTTVPAHARVDLDGGDLFMTYSAQAGDHAVPITVCRARLADVASVQTVTNAGQPFLYVVMKPKHAAQCGASREPVALMPIGTDPSARTAVATIADAVPRAAPAARTSQPAAVRPVRRADTWVERDRWYAFVRLRNPGTTPLVVSDGAVDHCRSVAFGCGRFTQRPIRIAPGSTATLATVMVGSARTHPSFTYWYAARSGARRTTGSGNSDERGGPRHTISTRELRVTELAAAALRGTPATVAARLVRRGSTHLGRGQRGVARVRVRVGADGLPKDAAIVSVSNHALTAAALEVAVSSTYAPAMRGGRPENAEYLATFRF
jgi:hypothetical protein